MFCVSLEWNHYGVSNQVLEEYAPRISFMGRWEIHEKTPSITSFEGKKFKDGGYVKALTIIHYYYISYA